MKRTTLITLVVLMLVAAMVAAQPSWSRQGQCPRGDGSAMGLGQRPFGGNSGTGMNFGRMGMKGGADIPGVGMLLAMKDELAMTPEQIDKIKKLSSDFALERVDRRADLEKARIKLRNLMNEGKSSEASVNAAIDEIARLKADMQKMQYAHHKQMQSVLTDEQLKKLDEIRSKRCMNFGDRGKFDQARREFRKMR
ncbi:MAG: Spy/CpxP family protein refolding chaperone [candidate division Zixibacteria bacterium]|nr:Spy/CpxP family protein refolding chaperone [candidate division Zixibacteria bacterium]